MKYLICLFLFTGLVQAKTEVAMKPDNIQVMNILLDAAKDSPEVKLFHDRASYESVVMTGKQITAQGRVLVGDMICGDLSMTLTWKSHVSNEVGWNVYKAKLYQRFS